MPSKEKKPSKSSKTKQPTLAVQADKYDLYLQSVQEPESEVKFFNRVFKKYFGRSPHVLQEDFCGTFAICCEWAKKKDRVAYGVDLDPEPIDWGREHNLSKVKPKMRGQVVIRQADVRTVWEEKADIVAAENFSYWIFKTRDELRSYLRYTYDNLADQGLLVLDAMGGGECYEEGHEDTRKIGKGSSAFTYVWEQNSFDPISADARFYIHFRFKDKSEIKRAFTYDWRFWTLPEIRELVREAGFDAVDVYWEGTDENGEGDGIYRKRTSAESDPCWIAYVVGVKGAQV